MKERKSFPLRLDPGLYREIEAWAADDLRSVNAQIEYLLADAVRQRRKKMDDTSNRSDSEKTK
jgi:hypothetical protein